MSSRTILFAGGGTGGHLFPGIAVADELRHRDPLTRIVFVGSNRSIESTIVGKQGLEHRILPVESLLVLKKNPFRFLYRNWQALRSAKRLLKELQPNAVVGLGGYASAPLVWAARRTGIPVILLEQNVIPGKSNRWLSRFATEVCVSFPETADHLPRARHTQVTGNPVRKEIAALLSRHSTDVDENDSGTRQLLILGGSQGADSLNVAVVEAIKGLHHEMTGWQVIHQTGPRDVVSVRTAYRDAGIPAEVEPFFHDMAALYARSHLVISRSGATTLAELACAGIPTILVPFPFAADDHQSANAQSFVDHGAAVMVKHAADSTRTGEAVANALRPLLKSPELRRQMGQSAKGLAHPDAARTIADVIRSAAAPHDTVDK